MINIECYVGFDIIMNATELEWHHLQTPIAKWAERVHVHTMPKKFDRDVLFYAECGPDSVNVAFYCRFNTDRLILEVIAIQK